MSPPYSRKLQIMSFDISTGSDAQSAPSVRGGGTIKRFPVSHTKAWREDAGERLWADCCAGAKRLLQGPVADRQARVEQAYALERELIAVIV